jgi:hypothetical protein
MAPSILPGNLRRLLVPECTRDAARPNAGAHAEAHEPIIIPKSVPAAEESNESLETPTYQSPRGHLTPTTRPLRKVWTPPLQSTICRRTSTCKSTTGHKTPRNLRTSPTQQHHSPLVECVIKCLTSLAGMKLYFPRIPFSHTLFRTCPHQMRFDQ